MFNRQHKRADTARGSWRRKSPAILLVALLCVAQAQSALAAIVNTVVATGSMGGVTIQSTATANVDVADSAPALTLLKSGTFNDGGDGKADAGDTISYRFTVANTGNVTLSNVTISDPKVTVLGGPIASLLPGSSDSTIFTASYPLTQADVDAGSVSNTAAATGLAPSGANVIASDDEQTSFITSSALTLVKSGTLNDGGDGRADVGDIITYQFVVTNTGPTTLTKVKVSDPLLDLASRPEVSRALARLENAATASDPMATGSIDTGLRVASKVDRDRSAIPARHSIADFTTDALRARVDVPQVPVELHAGRKLVRLSGESGTPASGNLVAVFYSLTNAGDGPLVNVHVRQPSGDVFGDAIDIIGTGETDESSVIFTHRLTDGDVSRGQLTAPAVVSAQSRGRKHLRYAAAPLMLADMEDADAIATASITPRRVASLAPGEQTTFTASYTLTQADIDAGDVRNTATASGRDQSGQTVTAVDSATVPVPAAPAIALVKTGVADLGADGVASAGDTVTYRFTVTNTGNVTVTNVTVADPLVTVSGGPVPSLAPGASDATTFTATYAVTQADLDRGEIVNQATVTGTPPDGGTVSDPSDDNDVVADDPTIVALTPAPSIALVKSVGAIADSNGNGITDAGDTIDYVFAVTNTGNVTLTNVLVGDPKITVTGGPLASLAPGATDSTTFRASYLITQPDADAGGVTNQATATGSDPTGATVEDISDDSATTEDDPTVTPIAEAPAIALVKSVSSVTDTNGNGLNDTGDVINYAFAVTNTGNVTLGNVTVTDPLVTVAGGPLATLVPGASDSTTFTANYVITGDDVRAGRVVNQATAAAASPSGARTSDLSDNASTDENDPTITPIVAAPGIALVKSVKGIVNTNGNDLTDAGDVIEYRFTISNTGNVPLNNVTVTDPLVTVAGGPLATLDAGETDSTTFTASYVITAADVAEGRVINQATAFGTSPANTTVSDLSDDASRTEDDPTVTPLVSAPAIALVKSVSSVTDANGNGVTDGGDVINYSFSVTNTGNVALAGVTVSDPKVAVTGGPIASLGVAQTDSTTFTASYVIAAADVDAGGVSNQATATGISPAGAVVSDLSDEASISEDDPTFTPIGQAPAIALIKSVGSITDSNGNGLTDAGDVINYAFNVTNTGNVPLSNVSLTDPLVAVTGGPLATLAAGATDSTTFTARYAITAADAAAGRVTNQATVTASTPTGGTVSDLSDDDSRTGSDPTVTPVVQTLPELTKTATVSQVHRGERVPFVIMASNVASGPVQVVDIMPPGFTYVAGSATANGTGATPVIGGRNLVFSDLFPTTAGTITLKLTMIAVTSAKTGRYINRAELRDQAGGALLATAQAAVTVVEDAVFDCGEIIGRVFDDKNRNGYSDAGEPGLPGVRVATVKGLLVTTDKHGRFHVPCADVPDAETGANFLMKLDTRTLPLGYVLTTENPRDVRLTRGKMTKLNFGAAILRQVSLDLKDDAFAAKGTALKPTWNKGIAQLMQVLAREPSVLKLTYEYRDVSLKLAARRLAEVKKLVVNEWKRRAGDYRLVIDARAVGME
jgi:large repetitive protein